VIRPEEDNDFHSTMKLENACAWDTHMIDSVGTDVPLAGLWNDSNRSSSTAVVSAAGYNRDD